MSTWKSDANVPIANDPSESAIARLSYGSYPIWEDVTFANERVLFKVEFYEGQSVTIEATAKARFAHILINDWEYTTSEKKDISYCFDIKTRERNDNPDDG